MMSCYLARTDQAPLGHEENNPHKEFVGHALHTSLVYTLLRVKRQLVFALVLDFAEYLT